MPRLSLIAFTLLAAGPLVAAPLPKDNRPVIAPDNVARLKPVAEFDHDVYRIVWGPGNGQVAILSFRQPTDVFDDGTLKLVKTPATGRRLIHMAVARDGTVAWSENTNGVELRDPKSGKITPLDTGRSQTSVAFSPDGKVLATGGYGTTAVLWDVSTGKKLRELDAGGEGGLTCVFSPDGAIVVVGNRNDETHLYETATGKPVHTFNKRSTHGMKFSPDGKRIAIAYVDGTLDLRNVLTGKLEQSVPALVKETYEVDWSPAGDLLVTSGNNGKIVLWDPKELNPLRELDSPDWVIQARFSPDGRRLWTAGGGQSRRDKRKVVVWGLADR
jgi:WD40 repeat protein